MKNLIFLLLIASSISLAQVPTITSFTPASGPPSSTNVLINGANFNATAANNVVYFGAVKATVTSVSGTGLLSVTVPLGATYSPITVLNKASGRMVASSKPFIPTFSPSLPNISNADFLEKVDFGTGTTPIATVIGDLDGDGKPDLISANYFSNTISVFKNTSSIGSITSSSFAPKVDFTTGTGPISIAIGDINSDGKPEIIVSNYVSNTVSVFLNSSTSGSITSASFPTKVDFTTANAPNCATIGDIDLDGKPELVVTNVNSNLVSIFKNTSVIGGLATGSFAAKVDFSTGAGPVSIALGDLDGDGKIDVIASNRLGNSISVLRNISSTGTISLITKVDFTTGASPQSVAIGDLDLDGKLDISVSNAGSNTISVLKNNSSSGSITSSSFAAKQDFSTGIFPTCLAIADLTGDGKPELVASNRTDNTISVLRNTSVSGVINSNSFSSKVDFGTAVNPEFVAIGDLDRDGRPDLISANYGPNNISVLRSNAYLPPVITSFSPESGPVGQSVTLTGSNFNSTAANNIVYFGAVKATITSVNISGTSIVVTVPAGATYSPIYVLNKSTLRMAASIKPFTPTFSPSLANISNADFLGKVDFGSGLSPYAAAIGDLDGDGKPDLVTANYNANTISIFRNTSSIGSITSSSFAPKVDFTTGTQPISIAIGDINSDGKSEIIVANFGSNSVSVFLNGSTSGSITSTSFSTKVDFTTAYAPNCAAFGDIDFDGKPELIIANYSSASVSIFRNTSVMGGLTTGSFAPKVDFNTGSGPACVAMGDLDADGKIDIISANRIANSVSILRNISSAGTISLSAKVDFITGSTPQCVAIGDLDLDSKLDISISNAGSNTISVFKNNSSSGSFTSSSFAAKQDFSTGIFPTCVAIADLNGDGKPDLVASNRTSNTVSILRNTSASGVINTNSFSSKVDFATALTPEFVSIGDLDRDGRPDLISANNGTNNLSVLRSNAYLPPVINSFSPESGPVGQSVTITGTSFNPTAANNIVYFGAVKATVTSASALGTSLVVTVPAGTTFQPITVLDKISGKSGASAKPFKTTFSPNLGSITAANFSPKVDFTVGTSPRAVAIGDIDGDGKPDMITANYDANTISIRRNVSTTGSILSTSFSTKVDFTLSSSTSPIALALGDLDGDGKLDVTVACANEILVFKNQATSGAISSTSLSSSPIILTGNSNNNGIAIGDMNLDGKPELVICLNNTPGQIKVFLNNSAIGAISFSDSQLFTTTGASGCVNIALHDFNSDGKLDIVTENRLSSSISLLRNTTPNLGTSFVFDSPFNITTGTNTFPQGMAIGDLNGDGKSDLVIGNTGAQNCLVYQNTSIVGSLPATWLSAPSTIPLGLAPTGVSLFDMDGDGKLDIATANVNNNSISVLRNIETGLNLSAASFAPKQDFTTGVGPELITIADLDRDGKPELISANTGVGANSISVLRNNSPQLIIQTGTIASPICASSTISVPFTVSGTPAAGNVFTAQLSNTIGSFATPTTIGTLASTTGGTISATIPVSTVYGTGYRIRVVPGSTTSYLSNDNGSNLIGNSTINYGVVSTIDQTICKTEDPAPFSFTTLPSGGSGVFTYSWYYQNSSVGVPTGNTVDLSLWTIVPSAYVDASGTIDLPALYQPSGNRTYACFVTPAGSPVCGTGAWASGGVYKLIVNPTPRYGTIAPGDQPPICSGATANTILTSQDPAGSSGYNYQWYSAPIGTTCPVAGAPLNASWSPITGANGLTYSPGALTTSAAYALFITPTGSQQCMTPGFMAGCHKVTVTTCATFSPGTLTSADQTICNAGDPASITFSTAPTAGSTYVWYYQNNLVAAPANADPIGSWLPVTPSATGSSFDPPSGLTTNRTYACRVTNGASSQWATGVRKVTVLPVFDPGTVSSGDQTFCGSGNPANITLSINPTGGSGLYTWRWYYKENSTVACPSGTTPPDATWLTNNTSPNITGTYPIPSSTISFDPSSAGTLGNGRTFAVFITPIANGSIPACGTATWATNCRKTNVVSCREGEEVIEEQKMDETIPSMELLGQCVPNPFNELAVINCFIPENTKNGVIVIHGIDGKVIQQLPVSGKGANQVQINKGNLSSGIYFYSLYLDGKQSGVKKMVITN